MFGPWLLSLYIHVQDEVHLNSVVYIHHVMYVCMAWLFRAWLSAVVMVMLSAPWKIQKAGALCLSRAVEGSPDLALFRLDSLDATHQKVLIVFHMMSSCCHSIFFTLRRVISVPGRF